MKPDPQQQRTAAIEALRKMVARYLQQVQQQQDRRAAHHEISRLKRLATIPITP